MLTYIILPEMYYGFLWGKEISIDFLYSTNETYNTWIYNVKDLDTRLASQAL